MLKKCEIFNNSEWYSPFSEFSKYLAHGWFAKKPLNLFINQATYVTFFKIPKLMKKTLHHYLVLPCVSGIG